MGNHPIEGLSRCCYLPIPTSAMEFLTQYRDHYSQVDDRRVCLRLFLSLFAWQKRLAKRFGVVPGVGLTLITPGCDLQRKQRVLASIVVMGFGEILVHCMLLGLVAFDYWTLRQEKRDWQALFEVHSLTSLGISVSTILAAIGTAIVALMTSQTTSLISASLKFLLPQAPIDPAINTERGRQTIDKLRIQ